MESTSDSSCEYNVSNCENRNINPPKILKRIRRDKEDIMEAIDTPLKAVNLCKISYMDEEEYHQVSYKMKPVFVNGLVDMVYYTRDDILFILFRGTDSIGDVMADINVGLTDTPNMGKIHSGFYNYWLEVVDLISSISAKHRYIKCYGHSMGGALATICSYYLTQMRPDRIVHCYTFGSPRVGDKCFASKFDKAVNVSRRYVNVMDPITHVPSMIRFKHVSGKFNLDTRGIITRVLFNTMGLMGLRISKFHILNHYEMLAKNYLNTIKNTRI